MWSTPPSWQNIILKDNLKQKSTLQAGSSLNELIDKSEALYTNKELAKMDTLSSNTNDGWREENKTIISDETAIE